MPVGWTGHAYRPGTGDSFSRWDESLLNYELRTKEGLFPQRKGLCAHPGDRGVELGPLERQPCALSSTDGRQGRPHVPQGPSRRYQRKHSEVPQQQKAHMALRVRMRVLLPSVITETTERVADSSRPVSLPFHKIPWTRHRT